MKKYVMGDIHGGYKALIQCLERSNFDYENDLLIQLGDICDGWSQTKECVEELLKIKNRIDIKGNHDEWFRIFIERGLHPIRWLHGGDATKNSYSPNTYITNLDIPQNHQDLFNHQILYYVDEGNRCFVHGGFDRNIPIEKNIPHELYWNRDLWTKALSCTKNQKLNTVDGFTEIFIGHTATTNWKTDKPMQSGGVWNIDTGAGWGGKLTIMNVDTKEYFQSDSVKDLYSEERGRN